MKKKISILSLALVFFVSTTGLPVTFYFCNMMNVYSFNKCNMDMGNSTHQSSCALENTAHKSGTNITTQDCCTIKVIDSKVKDNFLFSYLENQNLLQLISLIPVQNTSSELLLSFNSNKIYFDTSPPLFSGNNLYLTNSILLI